MGEHNKANIIKYTRKYMNITQAALAENICDPVTLARYESGKLEPSDEKFSLLMQKMGQSGEKYIIPLASTDESAKSLINEISDALEKGDYAKVEVLLENLKRQRTFLQEGSENFQYLKRLEAIVAYESNKIDAHEFITELKSALSLTFKDFDECSLPKHRVFTQTEILLISNIARQYGISGNKEKAIKIYESLEKYFMGDIVLNDYMPRYAVLANYSSVLGLMGYYDESIAVCIRGLKWMKKHNKCNLIYNFYYNIGWNIKKKIDCGMESETMLSVAQCYVWLGCELCKLYHEDMRNYRNMCKFYEENFAYSQ